MTPNTPGDPVQHNPDNLTPEQVGVEDGWRLLDEDEVPECQDMEYQGMQAWTGPKGLKTWNPDYYGVLRHLTYRTRLSRPELQAARGLPPISEPAQTAELSMVDHLIDHARVSAGLVKQGGDATPALAGDETTPRTDAALAVPWAHSANFANWRLAALRTGIYPWDTDVSTAVKWQTAQAFEIADLLNVKAKFAKLKHATGRIWSHTCDHHTDAERAAIKCPVCLRREVAEITRERDAAVHWASKLSKALTTTDECVGTATEQLQAANRENDSLRTQLTSIGDEIEAINKSREEQAVNLAKVSRENEELKSQLATVTAERDEVAEITAKYEAEKAIVSRIWKQLGCQTYEDAKGKSIYEWVQDGIEATKQLGTTAEQLQATVAESKVLHDAFDFEQSRAAAHVSRARTAEAALASVREMWAVLPTNDMIHYDNCACFQCSVRKVLSDDAGQSLLDELEKAKKDGARLDWLDTNNCEGWLITTKDIHYRAAEWETIREAIDAAMKNTVANTPTA